MSKWNKWKDESFAPGAEGPLATLEKKVFFGSVIQSALFVMLGVIIGRASK
jgi:hypothetical protein